MRWKYIWILNFSPHADLESSKENGRYNEVILRYDYIVI